MLGGTIDIAVMIRFGGYLKNGVSCALSLDDRKLLPFLLNGALTVNCLLFAALDNPRAKHFSQIFTDLVFSKDLDEFL